jgi:hypothetical protein
MLLVVAIGGDAKCRQHRFTQLSLLEEEVYSNFAHSCSSRITSAAVFHGLYV